MKRIKFEDIEHKKDQYDDVSYLKFINDGARSYTDWWNFYRTYSERAYAHLDSVLDFAKETFPEMTPGFESGDADRWYEGADGTLYHFNKATFDEGFVYVFEPKNENDEK